MQKDVIYIDTEDNITDIIAKVNDSEGKIVALVPPKRVGAIQSAVNLKLVHRAAEQAKKHLVVVTNNPALSALAGSAGIPIAKNLQSKPEMPEVTELENEQDDIIDGNDLPVGEHAKIGDTNGQTDDSEPGTTGAMGAAALKADAKQKAIDSKNALAATAAKARTKIPNFDSFRKKLFLIIAGVVLLTGFLVWAIMFAPSASIVIRANTSETALNTKVSVGTSLTTDLQAGTLTAATKSATKDVSVAFTATGKKDVGEKATGTVRFVPTNPLIFLNGATIPAGTQVVATGGAAFITSAAVVFDSDDPASSLAAGKTVTVTAVASGSSFNGANGVASGPSGFSTTFTAATAGGTDKTVAVVQQSDIDAVAGEVQKSTDTEQAKKDLISQFGDAYIAIEDTFKVDTSAVKPSPAVGQESADGKGVLAGKITYTMLAVPRTEAEKYLSAYFAQHIDGQSNQKVYDNGIGGVAFTNPIANDGNYIVTVTTNGKIGPKINEAEVKEFAKGKKSGEIKVYVEAINGVESAEVAFSPFWVTTAPNDVNRIKVQFNLND